MIVCLWLIGLIAATEVAGGVERVRTDGLGVPRPQASEFPVPTALEPAVAFWKAIFSEHDQGRVVLHDREDLSLIYRVVSLPRKTDGRLVEREVQSTIRRELETLKKHLKKLQRTGIVETERDRELLQQAGRDLETLPEKSWLRVRVQRGVADRFHEGMLRATKWWPQIRATLDEAGVPPQLVALAFVESTFDPKARSSAGAAGLWQLMPATARQFGLKVRRKHDERFDVLKATRAAAKMLRDNHRMLGSWPLAITGYNHGPYGVKRGVKALGTTDLVELIRSYKKRTWGFASKNFYAEFLAALQLLQTAQDV